MYCIHEKNKQGMNQDKHIYTAMHLRVSVLAHLALIMPKEKKWAQIYSTWNYTIHDRPTIHMYVFLERNESLMQNHLRRGKKKHRMKTKICMIEKSKRIPWKQIHTLWTVTSEVTFSCWEGFLFVFCFLNKKPSVNLLQDDPSKMLYWHS